MFAGVEILLTWHLLISSALLVSAAAHYDSYGAFSSRSYQDEIDFLISVGPRLTGSVQHNNLINRIESQLRNIGLEVQSENLTFGYYAASAVPKLTVDPSNDDYRITAVFPYSGFTPAEGVTGKLVPLTDVNQTTSLTGEIAVVKILNPTVQESFFIDTWDPLQAWGTVANPIISAAAAVPYLTTAKKQGAKAVVFVWDNATITYANALGQYVPFTNDYFGIPAVFVAGTDGVRLLKALEQGGSTTLKVPGHLVPDVPTRTLYSVVEGSHKPNESVILVTHTDGTNVIEENGHIALLQLAQDLKDHPPERTHVLVFTTGHLRIPAFVQGPGQATTRWLRDHPELWNGTHIRAIGGMSIEHLGALGWVEQGGQYIPTGRSEPEILYATTYPLSQLANNTWRGADPGFTRVSKPTPEIQLGEGQPLNLVGIPNISLVTSPLYLLAEWFARENGPERELVDMQALKRQVNSFRRLRRKMDELPLSAFG